MKEIIINVDSYNENSIRTVEGDNLSEVYKIYILKNKRRIDLTNKIAVMAYVDEYGSKRSNILNLNITNAAEGEIELPITNIISEHNGVYACQVAIYGENNSLEQTAPFSLIVENNIFSKISNAAINSSDFHILSEAIKTTNSYAEKLKEGTENIELQYVNKLNEKASKLELEVERKRIDTFVALPQGSTQEDAELIDARVGANGVIYDSLGTSIRSQYLEKVSLNRLNPAISKNFEHRYKPVTYEIKENGFYDKDYVFHPSNSSSKYTILDVVENEEYHFKIKKNWTQPAYFLLKNDTPLLIEKSETPNDMIEARILIPQGCNKLIIQWLSTGVYFINKVDTCVVCNVNTTQLEDNLITVNKLSQNIQDTFDVSYRNVDNLEWVLGKYLDANGDEFKLENYSYATIPVLEGDKFIITGKHRYSAVCYLVKSVTGEILLTDGIDNTNDIIDITNKEFTIPKGGSVLCINNYNLDFKHLKVKDVINIKYKEHSVPLSSFEPKLQEFYTISYRDVTKIDWVDNFYINSTGDKIAMEGYGYATIPVTEGTDVIISGSKAWQSICYLVKDRYGNVLLHDNRPDNKVTTITNEKFTIPTGGTELYIGKKEFKDLKIRDSVYMKFKNNSVPFSALENEIKDLYEIEFRHVQAMNWITNCFMTESGSITQIDSTNHGYCVIPVVPNTTIRITGSKAWQSICYLVKDRYGNVLLHDNEPDGIETKIVDREFVIPEHGVELYIGKYGFKELFIKDKLSVKSSSSPLRDKLIAFNGDSICEGLANGGGYAKILKDQTGCLVENRAISGGTLAINKRNAHMVVNDIVNMSDNADLVILEGGINDYWQDIPMGEMKPLTDFESEVDKETVLGALESIFRTCMEKWLGVPIIYVIVHPVARTRYVPNRVGYTFEELAEGIRKMCKKYSIAVVDLLNESGGFNGNIQRIAKKYTVNGGDGCHPNAEGYRLYYVPQIRTKAESLISE